MKNLIRTVCLFLLVALVQPGNVSAGEKMIEVKITNLSAKVVLTPPIVAASNGKITVFQLTEPASVALEMLAEKYNAKIVLNDAGPTLNDILLDNGLVDEISLLVSPVLVGDKGLNLFRSLKKSGIKLELLKSEVFDNQVFLHYKVKKD